MRIISECNTPIYLTSKGKAVGDAEEGSRRRAATASTGGKPQRQDPHPGSEVTAQAQNVGMN